MVGSTKSQTGVRSDPAFSTKWKTQGQFILSTFSCCTTFLALQNPKPGSDLRRLPMSDPRMLAGGFAHLKLPDIIEKNGKNKKTSNYVTQPLKHIKTKEHRPSFFELPARASLQVIYTKSSCSSSCHFCYVVICALDWPLKKQSQQKSKA